MLPIPQGIREYIDFVPGLREHVVDGAVRTPLARDVLNGILALANLVESSFTEGAENKATAGMLKIQAVLMSVDTQSYISTLSAAQLASLRLAETAPLPTPPPVLLSVPKSTPSPRAPSLSSSTTHAHVRHASDCKVCLAAAAVPDTPACCRTSMVCTAHDKANTKNRDHDRDAHHTSHAHANTSTPAHTHDECHANFRRRYAELREQYARRHAELKDTYERKYATLKTQYADRELEIKCKYDERHSAIKTKYNELRRRYDGLRVKTW